MSDTSSSTEEKNNMDRKLGSDAVRLDLMYEQIERMVDFSNAPAFTDMDSIAAEIRYDTVVLTTKRYCKLFYGMIPQQSEVEKARLKMHFDQLDDWRVELLAKLQQIINEKHSGNCSTMLDAEKLNFWNKRADVLTNKAPQHRPMAITNKYMDSKEKYIDSVRNCGKTAGSAGPNRYPCKVGGFGHALFHCEQFLALNLACRYDVVVRYNLCQNCFKSGHGPDTCFSPKCPDWRCKSAPQHNSKLCPYKQDPAHLMGAIKPKND